MKKVLKKFLAIIGLTTSLTVSGITGCSDSSQNNENVSQSKDVNKTYKTENYSLIYLDGNLYLATKYKDSFSWYFNDYKTGNLIGKIQKPAVGEKNKSGHYDASYEEDGFTNEYGYGKNIPACAEFPVSIFISSEYFDQQMFEFLNSNSEDLKNYFINNASYDKYSFASYYNFEKYVYDNALFALFDVKDKVYLEHRKYVKPSLYVCETNESDIKVFVGYRCSYIKKDLGNSYVYDIVNGKIEYIGNVKANSFVSVKEYEYDNFESKSIAEIKEEIDNIDIDLLSKTNEENLDNYETCEPKEEQKQESDNVKENKDDKENAESKVKKISANNLYVLSNKYSIIHSIYLTTYKSKIKADKYYFLVNTNQKDIYDLDVYLDLYNKNANIIANNNNCIYYTDEIYIDTKSGPEENDIYMSIDDFLKANNLEDMINSNGEYSLDEINEIYRQANGLNEYTNVESIYEKDSDKDNINLHEEKASADNLYVLDSQNSIVTSTVEVDKYYFLIKTNKKSVNGSDVYLDLYHDDGKVLADDNYQCRYINLTNTILIESDIKNNSFKPINDFLKANNLEDMISPNGEYNASEINAIYEQVNTLNEEKSFQKQYK